MRSTGPTNNGRTSVSAITAPQRRPPLPDDNLVGLHRRPGFQVRLQRTAGGKRQRHRPLLFPLPKWKTTMPLRSPSARSGNRAGHSDVPMEDAVIRKVRRWAPVDRSWLTWYAFMVLKIARAIAGRRGDLRSVARGS